MTSWLFAQLRALLRSCSDSCLRMLFKRTRSSWIWGARLGIRKQTSFYSKIRSIAIKNTAPLAMHTSMVVRVVAPMSMEVATSFTHPSPMSDASVNSSSTRCSRKSIRIRKRATWFESTSGRRTLVKRLNWSTKKLSSLKLTNQLRARACLSSRTSQFLTKISHIFGLGCSLTLLMSQLKRCRQEGKSCSGAPSTQAFGWIRMTYSITLSQKCKSKVYSSVARIKFT